MTTNQKAQNLRKAAFAVGVAVAIATILVTISGCAGPDTMSTVRDIHSMTPCGMMMDAMMGGHNHGTQPSAGTASPDESAYPSQSGAAEQQSSHAH
ncbi:hypothetical protein HZA56_14580 [Candidatus Poribacteria bacterium]|nr:hypothetical protein [Candidatus Poribacteria bacterium]